MAPLGVVIAGKDEAKDSKTAKDKYSKEGHSKDVEGAEMHSGHGSEACNYEDDYDGDDVGRCYTKEPNAAYKD